MLGEFHSTFFVSPDSGPEKQEESPVSPENHESLEVPLSDDLTSLFDDFVADSSLQPIIMSEKSEETLDQGSDSNDEEIAGYLAQFIRRSSPSTKGFANCSSADLMKIPSNGREKASSCTSSYFDENSVENDPAYSNGVDTKGAETKVPKINIFELEEKGKCTNRNAINARLNRMRKKQYLSDLEKKVANLSNENAKVKDKLKVKTKKLHEAQQEITYLRSVISNQKGLMSLLGNISNTAGVKLNASLVFSNNNLENSDDRQLNEANKCAGINKRCKRQIQDIAPNSTDNVSIKKTKNGMYVVNEKEKRSEVDPALQKTFHESYSSNNDEDGIQKGSAVSIEQDQLDRTTGGVCLHVSNDKVSIELCSSCASSAKNSWEIADDHSYFKQDSDDGN